MKLYEVYRQAKANHEYALGWQSLLEARDFHEKAPFRHSPQHGAIKLTICGQSHSGAKNYHESPAELNKAILEAMDFRAVVAAGVEHLRMQVNKALANCREEIDAVSKEIAAADAEVAQSESIAPN